MVKRGKALSCIMGLPVGQMFPLLLWGTQMWFKHLGFSNVVVGSVGVMALPLILKLPVTQALWGVFKSLRLGTSYAFVGAICLMLCGFVLMALALSPALSFSCVVVLLMLGVTLAMMMDAAFESLRIQMSERDSRESGVYAMWFGVGYRIGGLLVKMLLLSFVTCVGWTLTLVGFGFFSWILAGAVCFFSKRVSFSQRSLTWSQNAFKQAVQDLYKKWGLWVFMLPLSVVLVDTCLRSMLGSWLVDKGFSYAKISIFYSVAQGAGALSIGFLSRLLNGRNVAKVLSALSFFNTLLLLSCMLMTPNDLGWNTGLLMGCSGAVQGLFLHTLRLVLGGLTSEPYTFLQMSVFFSLWGASSLFAPGAGWVVDTFGWGMFCYSMAIIFLLVNIPLYFFIKKV